MEINTGIKLDNLISWYDLIKGVGEVALETIAKQSLKLGSYILERLEYGDGA